MPTVRAHFKGDAKPTEFVICKDCLTGDIDKRLRAHAKALRRQARRGEQLIGCMELPARKDYERAAEKVDQESMEAVAEHLQAEREREREHQLWEIIPVPSNYH
jgi:hypothetical protein